MSTHNYTAETYNGNLQILNNSISRINQTILPSDPISQFSMGYSVEIASFNSVLSDLQEICVKAISAYEGVKNKVCENDANSANGLVDSINDIEKLKSAFLSITEIMKNNVICYVGYNPETYQYEIDKKKLSELLQKENLTEAEKATLENTLKLSVDENGQVNEKYLETFLSCCYKKDYKVDNVDLNSVYPVYGGRAYNYDYYARNGLARLDVDSNPAYNYDYYATYSRNGNLEEILVRLDQDKYKDVILLSSKFERSYESEHIRKKTILGFDTLMKIKNSGKEINDESIKKELLQFSINEQETVGTNAVGNLVIDIDYTEEEYKPSHEVYNHYDVTIGSGVVRNDEDGQLQIYETTFHHSSIYTDVNSTGAGEAIIHNEINRLKDKEFEKLLEELNQFREDEDYKADKVVKNQFFIIAEAVAGEIDVVNVILIGCDLVKESDEEYERAEAAKKRNKEILALQQKYKDNWNSIISCGAAEIIAYLKLHGLRAENIKIIYNSEDLIDNILISDIQSNGDEDSEFRTLYEFYYEQNCSRGNDAKDGSIKKYDELSDHNGDGRVTFDDLDEEQQRQIVEWATLSVR